MAGTYRCPMYTYDRPGLVETPPVVPRSAPWKISIPPRVTMKGGILSHATSDPCTAPSAAPRTSTIRKAKARGQSRFV